MERYEIIFCKNKSDLLLNFKLLYFLDNNRSADEAYIGQSGTYYYYYNLYTIIKLNYLIKT